MTRKEKLTRIGAALSLFTAAVRGIAYVQEGKTRLGVTMVVLTAIGTFVFLWTLRRRRSEPG